MFRRWLRSFFPPLPCTGRGPGGPPAARGRPRLERLEDRALPSAAPALPVPAPLGQPALLLGSPTVAAITVQLPGLQGEPPGGLAAESVHGGETFSVGGQARFDPFQVILPLDRSTPALQRAAIEGTHFPQAQLTVFTGNLQPYVTFQIQSVTVGSFQVLGGGTGPRVEIDLVFSRLTEGGPGAALSLPTPGPGQPLTDLTLRLRGLQTTPPDGLHLESVHMGETFTVGLQPRPDAFHAVMALDANLPALERALVKGTLFPDAQLTLYTGNQQPAETFQLTDVLLTSLQITTGASGVPEVQFSFLAAGLTHP